MDEDFSIIRDFPLFRVFFCRFGYCSECDRVLLFAALIYHCGRPCGGYCCICRELESNNRIKFVEICVSVRWMHRIQTKSFVACYCAKQKRRNRKENAKTDLDVSIFGCAFRLLCTACVHCIGSVWRRHAMFLWNDYKSAFVCEILFFLFSFSRPEKKSCSFPSIGCLLSNNSCSIYITINTSEMGAHVCCIEKLARMEHFILFYFFRSFWISVQ